MLKTTDKLIKYLSQDGEKNTQVVATYVNAILMCGSKEDAEALLDYFVSSKYEFYSEYLIGVFEKWGDESFAPKIFDTHLKNISFEDSELPELELMELLGKLKFEPIKPYLVHFALNNVGDHYTKRSAALGLLNFDCFEIEELILAKIKETYQKNLFPEFTPALVCKLKDQVEVLENLYESGSEYCSTDCNAGIILGFSLCGKKGEGYFKEVLFDRNWEADAGATGTVHSTYKGTINLNISLIALLTEIINEPEPNRQKQGVSVLLSLLELRINDYSGKSIDTVEDLYNAMFTWQEDSDENLINIARTYELEDEAYKLERLFEMKMMEDVLMTELRG
ncbi:hypothetical protein V6R21_20950 [Limibacter armeniacum]|uniref:hypothetical protein n=1 Tax=Limibacter armeniacum TaxID=466084 RepID=UPI002FE5A9EF